MMNPTKSAERASAAKVAHWLVDKGRKDEAVALLSAWAASGPNDPEGQSLLAEALRIDPGAVVAKHAFERMEGVAGDHAALDAALARYGAEELKRLEREMSRPKFLRAQVGFNNNVKYKDQVFHIQTEDSGLDKPHIITHLFADGGRIIKSHKRNYAGAVERADVAQYVRALMKGQHMEMALLLREGRFDPVIEGRATGGLETLEQPPRVDLQKLAKKKTEKVPIAGSDDATGSGKIPATEAPSKPGVAKPSVVHFRIHVLRSLGGGPDVYIPDGNEALIGREGQIAFPRERFAHRREAALRWRKGRIWLEDFGAGNGIFLRIRGSVELEAGDEFIVGDQLLRVERNPTPNDGPAPGPTYFYSSPKWLSSFRVVQIFERGALGACVVARGTTLVIGNSQGDFVFPNDPLVNDQHCLVEEQAGAIVLADLNSRTGVFVRIKGEQELVFGDEFIIGRTRLILAPP